MSGIPTVAARGGHGLVRRARLALCVVVATLVGSGLPGFSASGETPVRIQRTDGTVVEGTLVGIGGDGIAVTVGGAEQRLAVGEARVLERVSPRPDAGPAGVRVDLVDGGWLEGDDLVSEGESLRLEGREGAVTIPVSRVRDAAWRRPGDEADARPGATWSATLPENPGSDLLVVAAADGEEFVECAVKSISADAVTVVLDEETIPVKRGKVLGIRWLRPAPAAPRPGAVVVDVAGGSVRAGRVDWSDGDVVLDGDLRLPAAAVTRLDWSAGRSVALTGVAPERTDVEPWFGGLATIPGLAPFFAPRNVPAGEGFSGAGLVLRPRTVAVWRVPAEGRRFRTALAPANRAAAVGAATVAVAVDGREVARHHVDAAALDAAGADGIPLDIDLAGARRLTVTVDFAGPTDIGCAVRLSTPVIDQ